MAGGPCMAGGMRGWGTCIMGSVHGRGHAWQGVGVRGRYYEMSGQYASYWNAFLLIIFQVEVDRIYHTK